MAANCTVSPAAGERFHFRSGDGATVHPRCANGTTYWPVPPGGSCAPVDESGQSHLLTVYYLLGGGILFWGIRLLSQRRQTDRDEAQQAQIFASMSDEQRSAVLGVPPPRRAGDSNSGGWRARFDDPRLTWTWIGIALAASNFGGTWLANKQQNVLSLSESNAIGDVDSVTSVIQDVFAFFEDGMTVLIGAAVGAGDPAAAGTLTLLGYIAGLGLGVAGGAVGTAAAFSPALMDLVVPAPTHQCGGSAAAAAANAAMAGGGAAELQALARPYWLISVWVWTFKFCNNVGTGVVLGTNSCFAFALATVLQQAAAIAAFLVFVAADGVPNTAAVGLSNLLSSIVFFVVIVDGVFIGPASRLVPLPSRAALRSAETKGLAWLAAKSGLAMMVATLTSQAQTTTTTQMLARMGTGLQYRATVFGTITGNFWLSTMLGYTIRLSGSKFYGADLRALFWWIAELSARGAALLGLAATLTMAVFHGSAPWAFASDQICALLETVCGAPEYAELYGNDFGLTYAIVSGYQALAPLAAFLPACLYAAQDFDYVRNISALGLGLFFVPLAVLGYRDDSFLLLMLAGMAPALLTIVGCGWRLRQLWRQDQDQDHPKGQAAAAAAAAATHGSLNSSIDVGGGGGGGVAGRSKRSSSGSVNDALADYRRSSTSREQQRRQTQALAQGREADYRRSQEAAAAAARSGSDLNEALL